jgi:ribosome maturation factor RimP
MELRQTVEQIAAPFLDALGAFIVDLHIAREGPCKAVRLFVDTDTGITIGQCTDLSRNIGNILEAQNVFDQSYILEVSSPDITKPLKLLRQYRKNIGRKFRVRYRKGEEIAQMVATLKGIEDQNLIFTTDENGTCVVPFTEIIESIEELPW